MRTYKNKESLPTTYIREVSVVYRNVKTNNPLHNKLVVSAHSISKTLSALIGNNITESFIVLALSTNNKVIGYHELGRGGINYCGFRVVDVFRFPIICGATSIIIAHNHPSGDCQPSFDDIAGTDKIVKASQLLGISVIDHIIVSASSYYSFLDNNMMPLKD